MNRLAELLRLLPAADWAGLSFLFAAWIGYATFARRRARRRPSFLGSTNRVRRQWMLQTTYREARVIDAIAVQQMSCAASFFASTTILIIGALVAVIGSTEKATDLVRELPFAARTSVLVFDLKLAVLTAIFVYAFFRFTWSIRQYTAGILLIAAVPEHDTIHDERLEGDRVFSAPDGRLALNGTVHAVQGTYAAYNQKLSIERGAITFSGSLDNPRLDVLAVRPNVDVRVGVAITGSTRQPRVSLFSDPDMSDNAKLSWLVLGRPPEETSGGDTAMLQAAAMALLAGDGDGAAAQLQRLNPLDTLSVRQTDGAVRDTILTVDKQLSQRWYIGYERVLSQTTGNWQLIYRIGQRLKVRLQTGVDNSIDVIWSWRWD